MDSIKEQVCPQFTPLGIFKDNVAHSTGKHGLKISDYTPVVGGATCTPESVPVGSTFEDFTGFKNGHYGVWTQFVVGINFDNFKIADHKIAAFEAAWMNGKGAEFGMSYLRNWLMVGTAFGPKFEMPMSTGGALQGFGNLNIPEDVLRDAEETSGAAGGGDAVLRDHLEGEYTKAGLPVPASLTDTQSCGVHGCYWARCQDNQKCHHALSLSEISPRFTVANSTIINYESAIYVGAWIGKLQGGYETYVSQSTA